MSIVFIYLFSIGLILGSLYNVIGLRIPVKRSIISPRSACPNCGHELFAHELIPIVSYVWQQGKCSQCKSNISPMYPFIELATGLLFISAPIVIGWSGELVIAWTLISLFMIIFVSDVTYMLIPDKVLLFFLGLFLFERIVIPLTPWWDSLLGASLGFLLLLLIAIASKGGMGGGDIKLFALIGFAIGTKTMLLSFFLATMFGALFGLIALLLKKVKRGNPIPFGPFIVVGTLTAYYFYEEIIVWYLQFISVL